MRRWAWAALLAILILAIAMRFLPLMQFSVWGSDSGEYYYLTRQLVDGGALSTAYDGWGFGYPYFPGMFLLTGEVSLVAGAGLFDSLLLVAPFVASLSVIVICLIALRAFEDIRAGLVAGAFLAVCTPAVFSTSHPIPGGIGDLLALLCLLLLLKSLDGKAALPLLALSSMALVMTHHLSTFFVIVPVMFALLFREAMRLGTEVRRTAIEGGYLIFILSLTLLFWYAYATPFRDRVIPEGFGISAWAVLGLAFASLLVIPLAVLLRRRLRPRSIYRPSYPTLKRVSVNYVIFVTVGAIVMVATALISTPGTTIIVDRSVAYWFLPIIFLLGLAVAGGGRAEFSRDGMFVLWWLAACGATMLLAVVTSNHVLLPYRQMQYLMEPLAVLLGVGAVFLHDNINIDRTKVKALAAAGLLSAGILLGAVTAYPPRGVLGGFEEGTTSGEMDSVFWLRETSARTELVATDHRMSSMTFGFAGINASWDDAFDTLHGNLSQAVTEMAGLDTPSGRHQVSMVLVDPAIEGGVALKQWETAQPLSAGAKAKFSSPVFIKLYEADQVRTYLVDLSASG